jgi:hypothetical protein
MISLGCLVSISNTAWWSRRKRRHPPTITPPTTPGRPRALIRMTVHLCRTTKVPPRGQAGRVGIDLHLGQKSKLGGGTPTMHSSTYYILSDLCLSMFRLLYCSSSYFCFPKHKKTKNIYVVSFCLSF